MIPKNEQVWVTHYTKDRRIKCIITSNKSREMYFLYAEDESGELVKIGRSPDPSELEKIIDKG